MSFIVLTLLVLIIIGSIMFFIYILRLQTAAKEAYMNKKMRLGYVYDHFADKQFMLENPHKKSDVINKLMDQVDYDDIKNINDLADLEDATVIDDDDYKKLKNTMETIVVN